MSLPPEISTFMENHGVLADEVWAVRPGTYCVKHKALERIAAAMKIEHKDFKVLALDMEKKFAAVEVCAVGGGRVVRTTGEAAPYNNKNGYPLAMAEKRGWDRAYLKLLNAHGALYSESEADEFGDPASGEKGTILKSSTLARDIYKQVQTAIQNATSVDHLEQVSKAYKEQIRATNPQWRQELTEEYNAKMDELKDKEAA